MIDVDNIEKLKILDRLVIWKSKNKIHIKDLEKPDEHGTIGFLPEGIFDFHRKNEKSNSYKSEGILDLMKFLLKFSKDPFQFLGPLMKIAQIAKKVNFGEEDFAHFSVKIFPDKDSIPFNSKKKNKIFEIPESAIEIFNNLETVSWKDCKNKEFQGALVYDKESMAGFLQKIESGDLVFIPLNEQTFSIIDQVKKSWLKLEPTTWKEDKNDDSSKK